MAKRKHLTMHIASNKWILEIQNVFFFKHFPRLRYAYWTTLIDFSGEGMIELLDELEFDFPEDFPFEQGKELSDTTIEDFLNE